MIVGRRDSHPEDVFLKKKRGENTLNCALKWSSLIFLIAGDGDHSMPAGGQMDLTSHYSFINQFLA